MPDVVVSSGAHDASRLPAPVRSARELIPLLREHAAEADRTGRLSETVITAMRKAGLLSLRVPAVNGGPEADLRIAFEVHRNLAHGCGSAAWVAMILSGSSLIASQLGEEARQELWGTDPLAGVCSCLPLTGTAVESPQGVTVTGRWFPASGVHQSRWAVVAASRAGDSPVLAVVPVEAGVVEPTWATTGLRATRSDTLVLDDVFVPRRRVLPMQSLITGVRDPAHPARTAPSFLPAALVGVAAPLLGMAEFAVEQSREWLRGRAGEGNQRATSSAVLNALADASSRVDRAHRILDSLLTDVERSHEAQQPADALFRGRVRMLVALAAADLRDAVRGTLTVFGGYGMATSNPVERVWRDVETACTHVMVSMDRALDEYGPLLIQPRTP
ncbi:acyl-CoA dehydrogenase family protein [Streptomyces liangshanensis]|uniref:Uncharacterized protein n=1 Tax=Streptomyces liangshanensis TaxID=2717324 RepID=A0A6G9GT65_9ACTN|nr:acyl-CoA dehydrogenase family protein [Streptomyces liangshanensis]QIQ01266.1 hypothetical protein HA039_02205 [Streptomyces liangshanensis]